MKIEVGQVDNKVMENSEGIGGVNWRTGFPLVFLNYLLDFCAM